MAHSLWTSGAVEDWQRALDDYETIIARQGVERLPELDLWYRNTLPASIAARKPAHVSYDELVRLTEWKMARGVWRARNLALVRGNTPETIEHTSAAAFATMPHPTAPISALAELAGVGPATASAIAAAAEPAVYPFFDELVAAQVPQMGTLTFTLSYYARYAAALRERAEQLGPRWTPVLVERALWAHVGGKAASRA